MNELSAIIDTKVVYEESQRQLERLQRELAEADSSLSSLENLRIDHVPANLEPADILLAASFGVAGALISSSSKVKEFLNKIHQDASSEKPKGTLGRLLHHRGDNMVTSRQVV